MPARNTFLSIAIFLVLSVASVEARTSNGLKSQKLDYESWRKSAMSALDEERYDDAIAAANEAIRVRPTAEIYCIRASARSEKEDYANAIADCNTALEKDADRDSRLSAYVTRAKCELEIGDFQKAISDANSALNLEPSNLRALGSRAMAKYDLGRFDLAIDDCDELIRLAPKEAVWYVMRGKCRAGKREYRKAISDCDIAIKLNPQEWVCYLYRGDDYQKVAEYSNALSDFERAAELDHENDGATAKLAIFLATCPQKDLRDLDKAKTLAMFLCAESDWQESDRITLLAAIYAEAGEFSHAVEMQENAVKVAEKDDLSEANDRLKLFKAGKKVLTADRSLWDSIILKLR